MTDTQELHAQLEPILETLQQFVMQEGAVIVSEDLRSRIDSAIDDARILQLDTVLEALEHVRAMLESDHPHVHDLLPQLFALQETIQTVETELPVDTGTAGDFVETFLEWDAGTDLEETGVLDDQARYLLDGALSRGLSPYLIRVSLGTGTTTPDAVIRLLEQNLSVVNVVVSEARNRVTVLVVDTETPHVDRVLGRLAGTGASDLSYDVRIVDATRLTGEGTGAGPWYNDAPPVSILLEPEALDRMRFFISRLESIVGADARPVVRELSRTLETAVSVSLHSLLEGLKAPLEALAAEARKRVVISVGGSVDRIPAEMSDLMRETLHELLANAIIHGIEPPDDRRTSGKPLQGAIRVFGSIEKDELMLRISDDGRGVSEEQVRQSVDESGTNAGGLARVRNDVQRRFGGTVSVRSGTRGSTVIVAIPAPERTWSALFCVRQTRPFVVPAVLVSAITSIGRSDLVTDPSGGRFLRSRDRLLPLVEPIPSDIVEVPSMAIVLTMQTGEFALAIDGEPQKVSVTPDGPGTVRIPDRDLSGVSVTVQPPG